MNAAASQAKLRFTQWWQAPITRADRIRGAAVGALACLWIFGLGRLMLAQEPVGLGVLVWWAVGGAIAGILLGMRFPKAITCILFPFSTFGIAS
jgi:hypothetical protein